jgi:hypothetical protein
MGPLLGRFGPGPLTALAFSCLLAAYVVFLRAGVRPDYPAVMLPAILLIGLAFGLGFSSLTVAATAGVPDAEQGLAASLFQTSFQVGGAVVLAIVTAVVDASGAAKLVSPAATLTAYRPALVLITGVAAVGALVALSGLRRQRELSAAPGGGRLVRSSDLAVRSGDLALSGSDMALSDSELGELRAVLRTAAKREPGAGAIHGKALRSGLLHLVGFHATEPIYPLILEPGICLLIVI